MNAPPFRLRPYAPADEDAAIELWRRTWQLAYPDIDFAERLEWWRERWRNHLVPRAAIVVAERGGELIGFVTVDGHTKYLDQLVVAPETWGSGLAEALLRQAKQLSPRGIDLHVNQDNVRALRFYEKQGFATIADSVNPRSGRLVYLLRWLP